jgi:hypothetical protein
MCPSNTGIINLAPISQLYVHTSVSDYSSLSCTGAQDIIAVIQCTENYGSIVHYTSWSPLDSEAIRIRGRPPLDSSLLLQGPIRDPSSVSSDDQRLHLADHPRAAYYIKENGSPLVEQGGVRSQQRSQGRLHRAHSVAERARNLWAGAQADRSHMRRCCYSKGTMVFWHGSANRA